MTEAKNEEMLTNRMPADISDKQNLNLIQ